MALSCLKWCIGELLLRTELTEKVHEYREVHKSHDRNGRFDIGIQFNRNLQQYRTLGRIMTGHSIVHFCSNDYVG